MARFKLAWELALRGILGFYWLYFSSQKWFDQAWAQGLLATAAEGNYLPLYGDILRLAVAPGGRATVVAVTLLEATLGILILAGFLIRPAGVVGALHSLALALTFTFCTCPWTQTDLAFTFWFYFTPALLNLQVAWDTSSNTLGLQRLLEHERTL